MPSVDVRNQSGKATGSVELADDLFGIEPNVPVMHQVVVAQLAAARAGTQSTKTRAEVRGGGAKPYRQKGTGRARQGSIRAPQFTGGGVAHGPKPRSYRQKVNKKVTRLALRSALSDRAASERIVVVDRWDFDRPSTKSAKAALADLGLDGRVVVVIGPDDDNAVLSFRNLPEVRLVEADELNTYDVLCSDWLVFTSATLPSADEVVAEAPAAPAETVEPEPEATDEPAAETVVPEPEAADEPEADEPETDEAVAAADEPAAEDAADDEDEA
ncbi:MAG: 50S ribosomal protein L4 [Actinomycetota bacterium]